MNNTRTKIITDIVNYTRETLNKGTHATVSRNTINDLTNIIEELFEEIDNIEKRIEVQSESSKAFKERLNDNAKDFDSIVVDMLKHIDNLEAKWKIPQIPK